MNVDAATATRRVAASQAEGGDGGGILTTDGAPSGRAGTLLRIIRLALKHPWRVAIAFITTIVAANFQLLIPQFLGQAVDHAHGLLAGGPGSEDEAQAALFTAAMMLLGASVLRGGFTMLHNYIGESVGHLVGYGLRLVYYEKLQRLSFGFYDRVHTGDLITRGLLDLEGVRFFFNAGMVRLVLLANLIGIGSYLVISSDTVLGLLALSFVPFVAWRSSVARLKLRKMWRLLQERMSELSLIMDENLGGIRVVRAFAAQDHEMGKFDVASGRALDMANRRIGVRVRNTTAMTFAYFIAMGLVLWIGGLKVIEGEISVGKLAEFLAFMTILQMPVRQLGMMVNAFARASTCGARLFEVLDLEPSIRNAPDANDLEVTDGVLRFEDVDFAYRDAAGDERVLKGVDFKVGPGRVLGIVGPPGSGKSTIAHLIPRFYDVGGGRITIDGQDIRDVTLESLRRAVGVVQQDTFMFTASIENNVAYGDPWADGERIARANRAAQLHDYVSRLPMGYETLVGERGVSLSGGQRQRLSIARSVMLKPAFLVFDDSTAAIDAATEQRIRAALKDTTGDRATIIISHRLSSLMHAHEILFIEDGRVVERGSHEELIAAGGRYRELYELQLRPAEGGEG
ncbi:MAG: ABC transporter ATP-binding protein [Rhodospirillales bacterium]|nr:ABC transporter ATP-binding protein [Rhodospirillales bacterium]MDP6882910.1 ABC transporter ATP-binding protein [Rhodospirillales bacterium]